MRTNRSSGASGKSGEGERGKDRQRDSVVTEMEKKGNAEAIIERRSSMFTEGIVLAKSALGHERGMRWGAQYAQGVRN